MSACELYLLLGNNVTDMSSMFDNSKIRKDYKPVFISYKR